MKTSFNKSTAAVAAACALALSTLSGASIAQVPAPLAFDHMLIMDSAGQVVRSRFGDCWHSGFGPAPLSTPQCDPDYRAPAPVAQQLAPAPVAAPYVVPVAVAAPPPAPVYEKVTFNANLLFDFDKSALRPAGRATLDEFVAKARELVDPGSVSAIGYADRIGTRSYNQKLSEERVANVKAYLLDKGFGSNQVSTSGRGETQPSTGDECGGPTTIACLQPDRHVHLEISGTRLKK